MSLSYPLHVNKGNDYVMFTAHQYRSNNEFKGQGAANKGGVLPPAEGEPIVLYMPNSTPQVDNGQSWNQKSFEGPLGMLTADLAVAAAGGIHDMDGFNKESAQGLVDKLKGQFKNIKERGGGAAKQLMIGEIAKIANMTASNALALAKGQIYNPNIELLYEGPQRRNFSMAFNFIPKNAEETARINQIIMQFKKMSAPKENGAMFDVPYIWQVKYMSSQGGQNRYMNAFKRAALSNITVQANPSSDMHATFGDGMPIVTSLALTFQEVDIITRQDHDAAGTLQGY